MIKPKPQKCFYKGNGCERENINESVLTHMCEGSLYFKCYEYMGLQNRGREPIPDEVYDRRSWIE